MQIQVIFIRIVSHLDSLWNRGTTELGDGLLLLFFNTLHWVIKARGLRQSNEIVRRESSREADHEGGEDFIGNRLFTTHKQRELNKK